MLYGRPLSIHQFWWLIAERQSIHALSGVWVGILVLSIAGLLGVGLAAWIRRMWAEVLAVYLDEGNR